ncbi:hypothetical protein GCM10028862_22820 [Luteimonas pelagia]
MAIDPQVRAHWRTSPLRALMWGGAAALLTVPWFAMRAGVAGVDWTGADFLAMGVLLGLACLAFEALARASGVLAYRLAAVLTVGTALVLAWANLAVGLIGDEGHPANLLYVAVLALVAGGALGGRLRAAAMARTLAAAATAQVAIGALAMVAGWGVPDSSALEVLAVTAFFTLPWLAAAGLFALAARAEARRPG